MINATDSRFFWLAIYAQPMLWVLLAVVALLSLKFIWLPLVGEYLPTYLVWVGDADLMGTVIALVLTITNSLAFSRCDKFSQASNLAGSALGSGNLAGSIASNMVGRFFR